MKDANLQQKIAAIEAEVKQMRADMNDLRELLKAKDVTIKRVLEKLREWGWS